MVQKIRVITPLTELKGDEMTRIMWEEIKTKLLFPYLDLILNTFDLSMQNREATKDQVTLDAGADILKTHVGVKCATITADDERIAEFGLSKKWPSPNGTIRKILRGTIMREPIMTDILPNLITRWNKSIIVARHASGDVYSSLTAKPTRGQSVSIVITNEDGSIAETIPYHTFKESDGIVLIQHNEIQSITDFAHACFVQALERKWPLYFGTKATITPYDEAFKNIFHTLYETEYKKAFEAAGITYTHLLVDSMLAKSIQLPGNFVWACKNYEGDLFSDLVAQAFSSLAMMTSVLTTPDGCTILAEAAHGTVTDLYREYQTTGTMPSVNPIASIFAWTRALSFRGQLDGNQELIDFCTTLEKVCIDTVESGTMTRDLAWLIHGRDAVLVQGKDYLDMDQFLDVVATNLEAALEKASLVETHA